MKHFTELQYSHVFVFQVNMHFADECTAQLWKESRIKIHLQWIMLFGRQSGAVVRNCTSHHYVPGLISVRGICWVSYWSISIWLRGFSPGTSVFTPSQNGFTANTNWLGCCAPRSCMDFVVAVRGAFTCFWSGSVWLLILLLSLPKTYVDFFFQIK